MDMAMAFRDKFVSQLGSLTSEIEAYRDEKNLWAVQGNISNSAGNLVLHLLGNLNHFIGAQLGHTGYVRQREQEFSNKNVPRAEMISALQKTQHMLADVLGKLKAADFEKDFPVELAVAGKSTFEVMLHLLAHLNYHLGQINYHRRLIEG